MDTFRPSFSFWPPPAFLGGSSEGLTAWIGRRDAAEDQKLEQQRLEHVRQIVEDHHDRHARTIYPVR
jgi:hypothetical protein